MSLDCESRIDLIHKYLDKSNQTWEEAEAARKLGMWPMTANRMYYSLINAFRGLLLADQHDVHTHAGMKSAIGQYYVLTGLLSPEDSKLFSQMETMRERADYDCLFNATETDIEEKYEPTKQLIEKIKHMIYQKEDLA